MCKDSLPGPPRCRPPPGSDQYTRTSPAAIPHRVSPRFCTAPRRTAGDNATIFTVCQGEPNRVIVSVAALRKLAAWRQQRLEGIFQGGESCLSQIPQSSPPAPGVGETDRTGTFVDSAVGTGTAEDAALPDSDRRRPPRARGGVR